MQANVGISQKVLERCRRRRRRLNRGLNGATDAVVIYTWHHLDHRQNGISSAGAIDNAYLVDRCPHAPWKIHVTCTNSARIIRGGDARGSSEKFASVNANIHLRHVNDNATPSSRRPIDNLTRGDHENLSNVYSDVRLLNVAGVWMRLQFLLLNRQLRWTKSGLCANISPKWIGNFQQLRSNVLYTTVSVMQIWLDKVTR